eukprot:2979988-Amphidinium_carterae.1
MEASNPLGHAFLLVHTFLQHAQAVTFCFEGNRAQLLEDDRPRWSAGECFWNLRWLSARQNVS